MGGTPLDHINNASDQIHRPLRRSPLRHQYSAQALPAAPRQRTYRIDDPRGRPTRQAAPQTRRGLVTGS